jgi:hypothetical protein
MKIFILFALLGCSLSINAASEDGGKIVTTFYGSKASSNANNPCKGATIRKCGTIETSDLAVSESTTMVTSVVRDGDGKWVSTEVEFVDAPVEVVKQKQVSDFNRRLNADVQIIEE